MNPFKVEAWDTADVHLEEEIAVCTNVTVARAAYDAAVKLWPHRNLTLAPGHPPDGEAPRRRANTGA